MIKHAEVQNAYLQGRQSAMVKLSQFSDYAGSKAIMDELDNQNFIRNQVGLGVQGISRDDMPADTSVLNPKNYATLENLSRLGMLSGAGGGTYLGGTTPRSAAISTAGAIGGAQLGGNLGRALLAGVEDYVGPNHIGSFSAAHPDVPDQLISVGGALGGLAGGLGAGYLSGK
jgi:hypothetical protein